MAKQGRDNDDRANTKRSKKRMRLIAIFVITVFLGFLFWFISQYKSVDEQLAAIEAARAIDDSQKCCNPL